jgi:predicted phosphoserine aminotransferase
MTTPFGKFFLPGPTEVLPEVAKAQELPMIGHRGAKTEALLGRLDEPLKAAFRTRQPVYIAATSATGLMEAAIRNGVRKKVLCLINGSFSERFAKIAAACGKEVVKATVPLGQAFEADAVRGLLDSSGADAVTLAHSETSTGVLNPIGDIAKVVLAKPDVMYLVDAVTSLGGSPVETDAWGLDFVLTGSQKAFALPPGLAFGVASPRLLERAKTLPDRGIYLDLIAYDTSIRKRQTPYTPALSLMYALEAQLNRIAAAGGIEMRWERHNAMRERVERWIAKEAGGKFGLSYLPREGRRSWTVSCLKLPEGGKVLGSAVAKAMDAKFGYTIGAGYGDLKDATIRIGHMGDHTVAEVEALLKALEEVIKSA